MTKTALNTRQRETKGKLTNKKPCRQPELWPERQQAERRPSHPDHAKQRGIETKAFSIQS